MTPQEQITNLTKVADYIDDSATKILLQKWENQLNHGKYEIGFVGRFSAGKSSLINAILGEAILPTARTETTAVLTKIHYGEEKKGIVNYVDGTMEAVPIERIKEFSHSNGENIEKTVSEINVYYPSEILKKGLVIIDSPGMDTVLNEHQDLAEKIMMGSVALVYVMSGSPTNYDVSLINRLVENNVDLSIVRTHMDNIQEHEESYEEAILNDESLIREQTKRELPYFALSTKPVDDFQISYEFDKFLHFLEDESAANADSKFKIALQQKINVLAQNYLIILNDRKRNLEQAKGKSIEEIDIDINNINKAKKQTLLEIDQLQFTSKHDLATIKLDINDIISHSSKSAKTKFTGRIIKEVNSNLLDNTLKGNLSILYHDFLSDSIKNVGDEVTECISKWCDGRISEIDKVIEDLKFTLSNTNLDFDGTFDMTTVNEITERQKAILEQYEELEYLASEMERFSDEQLEKLNIERENINKVLSELQSRREEYNEAMDALRNSYSPRYIEKPSKLGKIFKRIGTAGDIAMLLIPAVGWEKAGVMLAGKAANLASKGGAIANLGAKALKGASAATKLIAATDAAKDMTYLMDMGTKLIGSDKTNLTYQEDMTQGKEKIKGVLARIENVMDNPTQPSKEKKTNFFDYFSLSYWFEKAGELIDPPTKELDLEYERKYKDAENLLKNEAAMNMRVQMDEYNKLKLNQTREEELKFRKKIEKRQNEFTARRLKKEKEQIDRQKTEAYKKMLIETLCDRFAEALKDTCKRLEKRAEIGLDLLSYQVFSAASSALEERLENLEKELNKIADSRRSADNQEETTSSEVEELIHSITF